MNQRNREMTESEVELFTRARERALAKLTKKHFKEFMSLYEKYLKQIKKEAKWVNAGN